jgi:hypothetical protein
MKQYLELELYFEKGIYFSCLQNKIQNAEYLFL